MHYYNEIKEILINNEITKRAKDYSRNKSDLESYFKVGKMIVEAQGGEERAKYGDKIIKEYANKLTKDLGKGYTFSSLSRMRKFYLIFKNIATLSQQLTWSHYREVLSINDINEIKYYLNECENKNLTQRQLHELIKNNAYNRLSNKTKIKLILEYSSDKRIYSTSYITS